MNTVARVSWRSRLMVILLLAGLASTSAMLVAAPAHAASYSCATSHVCLWVHKNYEGSRQQVSGFADYTDLNGHLHDKASSWGSSNRSQQMCVIDWVNGARRTIAVVTAGNRTPEVPGTINDRADAVIQC